MPLYEYQCENCGEVFEVIQKFSDTPLTVHDKCGGAVYRLLSTSALQFKGSGWYVNDYAKGGKQADNGAPKKTDAPAGASSGSDSSSTAKPSSGSSSETKSPSSGSSSETKSSSSDTK